MISFADTGEIHCTIVRRMFCWVADPEPGRIAIISRWTQGDFLHRIQGGFLS